jgi:hypothetical protein
LQADAVKPAQKPLLATGTQSWLVVLEELLEYVDDSRGPARRHPLPGAPGVDFLNLLALDTDVDVADFPLHAPPARGDC